MPGDAPSEQLRVAEVIGALCLATDLGVGLPFEHGLRSSLVAMRLAERVGVDPATAEQAYYGCLLFYAGCTADAEMQAELFAEGALVEMWSPVMFGSARQNVVGVLRALAAGDGAWPRRALRAVGKFPAAVSGHRAHVAALCEVAQMLGGRLGLPDSVSGLFVHLTERWDGKGPLRRLRGEQIPLAVRIVHVARDATLHLLLGDAQYVAGVIRSRSGGAFDPAVVDAFVTGTSDDIRRAYDRVLAGTAVRSSIVEIGGRRVHLLQGGSGAPVVLLPGAGGTAGLFAPLLNELRGVRIIAPDRPGQGLSDPIDLPRTRYRDCAVAWLDRLIDGLGLDTTTLLGHSGGAMWALWYALDRPARVDRLVLIGPPAVPGTRVGLPHRVAGTPGLGELVSRVVTPSPASVLRFAHHAAREREPGAGRPVRSHVR